mmetsp:Transcript_36659/g.114153  ORF Transcript_36659/g.114153 Transcript_36659/m.114153 type:complete len:430 (-) Transcript_36659:677-1966(-)
MPPRLHEAGPDGARSVTEGALAGDQDLHAAQHHEGSPSLARALVVHCLPLVRGAAATSPASAGPAGLAGLPRGLLRALVVGLEDDGARSREANLPGRLLGALHDLPGRLLRLLQTPLLVEDDRPAVRAALQPADVPDPQVHADPRARGHALLDAPPEASEGARRAEAEEAVEGAARDPRVLPHEPPQREVARAQRLEREAVEPRGGVQIRLQEHCLGLGVDGLPKNVLVAWSLLQIHVAHPLVVGRAKLLDAAPLLAPTPIHLNNVEHVLELYRRLPIDQKSTACGHSQVEAEVQAPQRGPDALAHGVALEDEEPWRRVAEQDAAVQLHVGHPRRVAPEAPLLDERPKGAPRPETNRQGTAVKAELDEQWWCRCRRRGSARRVLQPTRSAGLALAEDGLVSSHARVGTASVNIVRSPLHAVPAGGRLPM